MSVADDQGTAPETTATGWTPFSMTLALSVVWCVLARARAGTATEGDITTAQGLVEMLQAHHRGQQ